MGAVAEPIVLEERFDPCMAFAKRTQAEARHAEPENAGWQRGVEGQGRGPTSSGSSSSRAPLNGRCSPSGGKGIDKQLGPPDVEKKIVIGPEDKNVTPTGGVLPEAFCRRMDGSPDR